MTGTGGGPSGEQPDVEPAPDRAIDQLRRRRDAVVSLDSMREITGEDGREVAERLAWADEVRAALTLLPDMDR